MLLSRLSVFLHGLFILQNFINSGAGYTELTGYFCRTGAFLMLCQHSLSVHGSLPAKPDPPQSGLLSAFTGTLQYSPAFSLGDS